MLSFAAPTWDLAQRAANNSILLHAAQGGHAANIKKQIQQQFQRNASETDPSKVPDGLSLAADNRHLFVSHVAFNSVLPVQIAEQKEAAVRGLSNYMFMEAQRMAKVLLPCPLLLHLLCRKASVSNK